MGGFYRGLSRPVDAFKAFRAGLDVSDKMVSAYPAIIEYRRFQARCLNGCGDVAQGLGRPEEALAYYQRAPTPGVKWSTTIPIGMPSRLSWPARITGSAGSSLGWAG